MEEIKKIFEEIAKLADKVNALKEEVLKIKKSMSVPIVINPKDKMRSGLYSLRITTHNKENFKLDEESRNKILADFHRKYPNLPEPTISEESVWGIPIEENAHYDNFEKCVRSLLNRDSYGGTGLDFINSLYVDDDKAIVYSYDEMFERYVIMEGYGSCFGIEWKVFDKDTLIYSTKDYNEFREHIKGNELAFDDDCAHLARLYEGENTYIVHPDFYEIENKVDYTEPKDQEGDNLPL